MPSPYFVIFELIIYVLFLLCLRHAWRKTPAYVLKLISGALFGVLLELATIRQLHAYQYGQFLVMVFDVPLCIGVAWGTIIYSAMEFSDASSLPYWLRPILDGLLALNIDLTVDALAIRFGMWNWGQGLQFQYFGVPYANFWAWFWVVASFSLGWRLLARRPGWIGQWLPALLALFVGLAGVLGTNALIVFGVPADYRLPVIAVTLLGALGIVLLKRPAFYQTPVNSLVFWVPFIMHVYFLAAGLVSGVIFAPWVLLLVSLAMLAIALWLHRKTVSEGLAGLAQPSA